ncbi:hypothetical protein WJX72_008028 [[Myrmecia] bisecta]|uniref:Uncharacterized protein n=1 Tax=[Myrmecia] bisecta TaxID=41462 RepID=A0AAW1PP66_9CHLO
MPLSPLDSKQSGAEYTLGRLASPSAIPRSPYSPSPFASRHSFLRASVTPSVGDASIASYESLLEEHADRLANDYFTCLSGKLEARLKSMVDEKLQQLTPSKPSP